MPTAIWACQEASSPLDDGVGAVDLAQSNTPLFQQADDPLGRFSVGGDATTDAFLAASAASLDIDAVTSASLLVRFSSPAVSTARAICGKRQSSGGNGYGLELTAGGNLLGAIDGGAADATATVIINHADGAFHDAILSIDRGAQTILIASELGQASASTASVGSATSTQAVRLLGDGFRVAEPGTRISYCAVWIGTALTVGDLAAFRGAA